MFIEHWINLQNSISGEGTLIRDPDEYNSSYSVRHRMQFEKLKHREFITPLGETVTIGLWRQP